VDNEPLRPIASDRTTSDQLSRSAHKRAKGRPADIFAAGFAALACLLSTLTALLFFSGFAETDSALPGLASAFIFAFILMLFAAVPAALVCRIACKAWISGLGLKHALWAIALVLPWAVLSTLLVLQTPLPLFMSGTALILSSLLLFWAGISAILAWKNRS
jgi:hypothetical protein